MPIYVYHCPQCDRVDEEYQGIREEPLTACPECGDGGYHRVPTVPHSDMFEFRKPIEMYSIGCTSLEDIYEFRQKCPDVHISDDPNDPLWGVPVARNRKEKLKALKAVGFEEKN